jgi:hypothetical protein
MPTFPSIDLTRFDLSKIELPKVDLATFADTARDTARDAAYVAIGASVLAVREVNIAGRSVVSATLRQARSMMGSAA